MPARPVGRSLLALTLAAAASAQHVAPMHEGAPSPVVEAAPAAIPSPTLPPPTLLPVPADVAAPHVRATLLHHAAAGKQPTSASIADRGRTLLVANRGDNTVSIFDTATMKLARTITDVGYGAWGVLAKDDATFLVANWAGSTVAVMDRASGKRLGEIPVGMKPSFLALSPDGGRVYAAGNFGGDVSISDTKTRKLLRALDAGRRPMGVAASPDGRWLYVASCESRLIQKVDLKHEVVLEKFSAPLASTTNLALTSDGRTLLAAGDENRLLIIDTATGSRETVRVGLDPSCVALTPDGRTALVANYGEDSVSIVDLRTLEAYGLVAVGRGPIDVQTDGQRFYTCNDKAGSVSAFRLDPIIAAQIPDAVVAPRAGQ